MTFDPEDSDKPDGFYRWTDGRARKNRKDVRVDITSWAEIIEVGKDGDPISVTVRDIGRGGSGAYSMTPLRTGTHIEIRLKFLSRKHRFVIERLWGRVVSSIHFGSSYAVGIAFVAPVDDKTSPRLSAYLRDLEIH